MSEAQVKQVYETLSKVETRLHKAKAYPIHKRLFFGDQQDCTDVYDWIFQHIDLPASGKVLDAGCGVGYGSFYLCERMDYTSLGISLSQHEINYAKAVADQKGMTDRCRFAVQSFDAELPDQYDLIIGVESIKHSMQLEKTLQHLIGALSDQGKLIILEDLFVGATDNKHTQKLLQDWHLQKAYTLQDYRAVIEQYPQLSLKIHDLSDYVIHKPALRLKAEYLFADLAVKCLQFIKKHSLFKIMRGGYALETLYQKQQIKYQILEISKA